MAEYALTKVNQYYSFKDLSPEIYRSFVTYGEAGLCHGMIRSKKCYLRTTLTFQLFLAQLIIQRKYMTILRRINLEFLL